jgi:hypothetical protein
MLKDGGRAREGAAIDRDRRDTGSGVIERDRAGCAIKYFGVLVL